MSYLYFPGCSLKGSGRGYEESMLSVFGALNIPLNELEDWNCCGATAYMSISELKAFALSARNLALAEHQSKDGSQADMVVPCAACYLGLNKAQRYLHEHAVIRSQVCNALKAANLEYHEKARVRHPLDVFVNDIGIDKITAQVKQPLKGMKVACYYGCQIVRPYADFDDQHEPTSMDKIIKALGGEVINWPLKTRCCGGSLTGTVQEVGQRLSYIILREAKKRGADVVATACPLCQFNLECYQSAMSKNYKDDVRIAVVYFTQLMGLAFGLPKKKLGLNRLFVPFKPTYEVKAAAGGQNVNA